MAALGVEGELEEEVEEEEVEEAEGEEGEAEGEVGGQTRNQGAGSGESAILTRNPKGRRWEEELIQGQQTELRLPPRIAHRPRDLRQTTQQLRKRFPTWYWGPWEEEEDKKTTKIFNPL